MKTIQKKLLIPALAALLIVATTGSSWAHYDHDDRGWYDEHHHRHDYVWHHGHRGYWDHDREGFRIFVTI